MPSKDFAPAVEQGDRVSLRQLVVPDLGQQRVEPDEPDDPTAEPVGEIDGRARDGEPEVHQQPEVLRRGRRHSPPLFCFAQSDPLSAQLGQGGTRRSNRVENIGGLRVDVEACRAGCGAEAGVVCGHHGISKLHVHGKEGTVPQVAGERRSAAASHAAETVRPCDHGPTAGWGLAGGRRQNHARHGHVLTIR